MSDWQLDRLPGNVRQEAENAAQRDGLPLHRWLGKLIRETCADEGIAQPRELSANLVKEPIAAGEREHPVPPRSTTEPIRVPSAARFADRAAMPSPPRQPANGNDSGIAARAREAAEPAPAPGIPRFGAAPRMPEPRVAEALHVIEPRAAAAPRPPVRVAPAAREAIVRDIAAVRSAAQARSAEAPATPPARERAFAASPVSPLSTAAPAAAQSPESSLSTAGESWSARRARAAATGRYSPPRRGAAAEASSPRSGREPAAPPIASALAFAPPGEDRAAMLTKLAASLRRNELSPVGEARLFLKLMTEQMASIDDITAATGRTREQVARSLRLLGLSDRLRDLIDRGALSREQAFALLDVDEPPSSSSLPPSSGQRVP